VIICKPVGDDKEVRVEVNRYSNIGRIYFDPKTNQHTITNKIGDTLDLPKGYSVRVENDKTDA